MSTANVSPTRSSVLGGQTPRTSGVPSASANSRGVVTNARPPAGPAKFTSNETAARTPTAHRREPRNEYGSVARKRGKSRRGAKCFALAVYGKNEMARATPPSNPTGGHYVPRPPSAEEWPHPATVRTPRQRMPRTIVRRQTLPRTMRTTRDRGRSSRLHRIVPLQPRSRRLRRISRRRKADRTAAIRLTGRARQCRAPAAFGIFLSLCAGLLASRPTEATVDPAATVEAAAALTQVRTTARDAPTAPRQPTRLAAATAPTNVFGRSTGSSARTPRAILEAATTPRAAALTLRRWRIARRGGGGHSGGGHGR